MKLEVVAPVQKTVELDSSELLRQCAKDLRNSKLWDEFYSRFRRKILLYLLRAFRMMGGNSEGFIRYSDDWMQEFLTKLVQNDGRVINSFRGTTENSVCAFLCSIAVSIVADQLRYQGALRRRGEFSSLDQAESVAAPQADSDARLLAILKLIDIEKVLRSDGESKNPERDLLIFKLHFVEGLSPREIASIPALKLTTSGLEKVLGRVKNRLVRQERE
jgi:DNA-directed RNA polymerase specialized sigma24 family protein